MPKEIMLDRPYRSFSFPNCNGPGNYHVNIWTTLLEHNVMVYEVTLPQTNRPYTFVVHNYNEMKPHLKFFHHLYSTDAFNTHGHFIGHLWNRLNGTPYRPDEFDISLALQDEPKVYRAVAAIVMVRFMVGLYEKEYVER